jgi:DNA-binding Lrp family transcriptional regulator
MEILGKILGSTARVKIMRLFLLNKSKGFKNVDIVKRSRVSSDAVRREIRLLASAGFLKKRGADWCFDPSFKYGAELEELLINTDTLSNEQISGNFKKAGRLKFLVVSGIFIKNKDSEVDLLIVGDKLKKNRIEEGVRRLEAEIGAELTYAFFETKEFIYRFNMYDKLVRDILDFPHEVLLQGKDLNFASSKQVS